MRRIIFVVFGLLMLTPAFAGPKESSANPELAAFYEKAKAADSINKEFQVKIQAFQKKEDKPGSLTLTNEQELRELAAVVKAYPETPDETYKGRALFLKLSSPSPDDIALLLGLRTMQFMSLIQAYGLIVRSGEKLGMPGAFKRDVVATFSKTLARQKSAAMWFIEPAVSIEVLRTFSERNWIPSELKPELAALASRAEKERKDHLKRFPAASSNDGKTSDPELLRKALPAILDEARLSTALMKELPTI